MHAAAYSDKISEYFLQNVGASHYLCMHIKEERNYQDVISASANLQCAEPMVSADHHDSSRAR